MFARIRVADRRGPDDAAVPDRSTAVLKAVSHGALVGLAWHNGIDPAEVYVDPAHRGRGIGRRLVEEVFAAGKSVWAHGTLPAARAIAAALGAHEVRTLLQMRRHLDGRIQVVLPDGVTIRTFVNGEDDDAFLGVNARAFAWHPEQSRLDHAGLAAERAQPWFDANGFFVAERDHTAHDDDDALRNTPPGTMLGFHWTKVHVTDPTPPDGGGAGGSAIGGQPGPIGEVYVIGVDPQSRVRRLGAPLTLTGLNYLWEQGISTVMLYVESDNSAALRLYDRLGFTTYATDTVYLR